MRPGQYATQPATRDHLPATLSYEATQLYEQNHLVYRYKGLGSSHAYETLMRPGCHAGWTSENTVSREIQRIDHRVSVIEQKATVAASTTTFLQGSLSREVLPNDINHLLSRVFPSISLLGKRSPRGRESRGSGRSRFTLSRLSDAYLTRGAKTCQLSRWVRQRLHLLSSPSTYFQLVGSTC